MRVGAFCLSVLIRTQLGMLHCAAAGAGRDRTIVGAKRRRRGRAEGCGVGADRADPHRLGRHLRAAGARSHLPPHACAAVTQWRAAAEAHRPRRLSPLLGPASGRAADIADARRLRRRMRAQGAACADRRRGLQRAQRAVGPAHQRTRPRGVGVGRWAGGVGRRCICEHTVPAVFARLRTMHTAGSEPAVLEDHVHRSSPLPSPFP